MDVFLLAGQKYQNDKNAIKRCHLQVQQNIKQMSSSNCTYIYQTKNLPFQVYPHRWFFTNDFLIEIQPCAIISVNQKLLIISRVRVGYEMVGGATYLIRYNHLISNKRGWNNCFIKNAHRISRILPDFICKNNQF